MTTNSIKLLLQIRPLMLKSTEIKLKNCPDLSPFLIRFQSDQLSLEEIQHYIKQGQKLKGLQP